MTLESKGLRLIAAHNNHVQKNIAAILANFAMRMANHDQSKYSDDEAALVVGKPALDELEYNTPEYEDGLKKVQAAIQHHYAKNSHHPEHYKTWECNGCFKKFDENTLPDSLHCDECLCEIFEQSIGVCGMSLLDLIEMACDWNAAAKEHSSTFEQSVSRNIERFNLSTEMQKILINTGREMGWI